MAQADDSSSLNTESPLKRKAISECRLQDPKIWTKISWIRTNFIKDLESGVRKTDFYNYVTEHLGKTGYRDVWHLLKIAYPHVDRVRRGRKYMYWGIRHADDNVKFEETDDGNNGEDEDEETNFEKYMDQDQEFIAGESLLEMEVEGSSEERCENQMNELDYSEALSEDSLPLSADTKLPSGVLVKSEKETDIDDEKQDDVMVIEFKDKEVFASFEDYEKSKQTADQNGNLIKVKSRKTQRNKNTNEGEIRTVVRSLSPPLEIFSFKSLKDDDKNKNLDLSSSPKDHHDNDEIKNDCKDNGQMTSIKHHDGCHVDNDNSTASLKDPENGSLSKTQEGKLSTFGDNQREKFASNLLHPENINRMCMPLIKDLRNKNATKTRPPNENNVNDTVANDQLNDVQNKNSAGLSEVDADSSGGNEVGMNGKFLCHPLIVSVASIAGVGDIKGSDKTCSDEINNILKASQLQSCKSVTARLDVNDGSTRLSPSPQRQSSPEGEAEYVVVQDRGIQVSEQIHTCNPLRKRSFRQIKPTACQKPSHSEHASKKLSSPNSTNVCSLNPACSKNSSPIASGKGQGVQIVSTLEGSARAWHSAAASSPSSGLINRTSLRSQSNNVPGQPRLSMAVSRNSHSVTSAMGNLVRSEEPLMKALMKKPTNYHTLAAKKRDSPDRSTYLSGPRPRNEQRRLLPKSLISTEVVNTVNKTPQDLLSPKYSSSQNVLFGATSTIEHRPSLTLPHGEKQIFDQNMNKTRATNERNNGERSSDDSSLRTRDFLRNLLSNPDSNSNSAANASTSDLRVTVECLSSELEKERTMRLRLEIELRKVENQLGEERKMNELLASLLMKRT